MPSKNRRDKGERISIELLVDYGSEGNYLFDFCKDLGAGGVFIATKTPKDVGESLNLTFTLPDSKKTLKVNGTVMWSQAPRGDDSNSGMGVQFTDYDEDTRKALNEFVDRYAKLNPAKDTKSA